MGSCLDVQTVCVLPCNRHHLQQQNWPHCTLRLHAGVNFEGGEQVYNVVEPGLGCEQGKCTNACICMYEQRLARMYAVYTQACFRALTSGLQRLSPRTFGG